MRRKLSEREWCRQCDNEDAHSDFVANLALQLFDGTQAALHLPAGDRRYLASAAALHDLGFRDNPRDHAAASARRVLADGIADYTPAQTRVIAAIMLRHTGRPTRHLQRAEFAELPDTPRIQRLAAILRVADGLDHGHIQDARIRRIRCHDQAVRVTVCSNAYPGNIPWAEGKADLWQAVFGQPLELRAIPPPDNAARYDDVIRRKDSVLNGGRKALYALHRIIQDNVAGALEGDDPEPLHDIRVAIRRARSVLGMLRKPLVTTRAEQLRGRLGTLCRTLGPMRDAQVWLAFLEAPAPAAWLAADPDGAAYLSTQRDATREQQSALVRILRGRTFAALRRDMQWLLRAEIPARMHDGGRPPRFARVAAQHLHKCFIQTLGHRDPLHAMSSDELHTLRKRCRQLRYGSELAEPVLDPIVQQLTERTKRLADALGDVHDMDVHRAALDAGRVALPTLAEGMRERREQAMHRAIKTWKQLCASAFRKRVRKALTH